MNNLIGQHLGPYRILEQIGLGGMATVYKAYQPAMDRYVAVKVIASHFVQDQRFLQRFRREARAVAQLEHAHILPVYDSGEAENRPYLVMRYLEAGTLKDRMTEEPLPLGEVNRIIGQVGSALDYAHRMGVIHRDVKPTNVLLDAEGDTFLTDFGLAKMVGTSVQLTGTGVGIGTPAYMSPEQGKGAKVDSRADVYSLGVMLYEMVTGHAPYEAETPLAVVLKHITEPLPLPRLVRPDLPEEVERVILRALAKEPDDRFQTAGEMVRALDAAVRAAEAAARTEPGVVARAEPAMAEVAAEPVEGAVARAVAGVRGLLPAGWGRTVAWVTIGIVALVAFFLILSRVPLRVQISGGQLEVVRVVERTATATPEVALAATLTEAAVMATLPPTSRPTATRTPRSTPIPTRTPAAMGRIVYVDDRTNNHEIYVANSDGSDVRRLTDHPSDDWLPAWSPDGTRVVFASDRDAIHEHNWQLYVMDADGSNLTKLTYTDNNEDEPSWSPDGSRIAFHSGCDLAVINADGSNWTTLVEWSEDLCAGFPTWSPDSHRIAFDNTMIGPGGGPYQYDVCVVNDDGSDRLKLAAFTLEEKARPWVVWSPDGSRVAFEIILDGQQRYYAVNSDGSSEPVEIPSIPDSWYPWYWPQWGSEEAITAAPTPTDTPVGVGMQCDVYSKLTGSTGDLASRNPQTFFAASVQGGNAAQVVVESPSGEIVLLSPEGSIWVGERHFGGHIQGLPQARGTYTFTALDAYGTPIPGAVASDVYVGGYEPDPPANVRAEVVEAGVLVTWNPSPVIPGAFDPSGSPPLGNYQIGLYGEGVEAGYGWRHDDRPLPETSHLIPFRRQDFGPGDLGLALEEMEDGVYYLSLHAFSVAPEGTAGHGIEGEAVPAERIRIVIEGGQMRVEAP